MLRQIAPVAPLLLGSAFLLFSGGINGLILPVRGAAEGFSSFSLGLLGTGWAIGFVSGCLRTPQLVGRVGHIRAFAAMAAVAAITVLLSLLIIAPWAWIPLRALCGFAFAGAAMIVESWLNEKARPEARGKVFGIYTMINLGASTAGQMALVAGDASGHLFFVVAAIFYAMALLPTAITPITTPLPLTEVRLDLPALFRNSPVAFIGVLMIGISNGAFGTLAPVYAADLGLSVSAIAIFTSAAILAGALSQMPVGALSDRIDRRIALVLVAALAIAADLLFILMTPERVSVILLAGTVFGAAIYSLYPIAVAHANDHAAEGRLLATSGGLLVMFGIGSILGPLMGGALMSVAGPSGLFFTTLFAHLVIFAYTIWRIGRRAPVAGADKERFTATPLARSVTPETLALMRGAQRRRAAMRRQRRGTD